MRFNRLPMYAFLTGALISALLGTLAMSRGLSTLLQYLLSISLIATGLALAATACMAAWSRGRLRGWMIGGMATSILALGCWSGALWFATFRSGMITDWYVGAISLTGWSILMMAVGLLYLPHFRSRTVRAVRVVTVMLASAVMVLLVGASIVIPALEMIGLFGQLSHVVERALQSTAILIILTLVGMIGIWLMARMPALAGHDPRASTETRSFHCTCPRCGSEAQLRSGGDACPDCGLQIRVMLT